MKALNWERTMAWTTRIVVWLVVVAMVSVALYALTAWADDMDRYPPPGPDGRIPWVELKQSPKDDYPKHILDGSCELQWEYYASRKASGIPCNKPPNCPSPVKKSQSIVDPADKEFFIREWAASGEVCRVLGHRWKYLHVIIPTGEIRECSICGKAESKKEVWE